MYYSWKDRVDFSLLKGRVCSGVESTDYEIIFYLEDNLKLVMQHDQDCCESVYVESIVGDLKDIVGEEILIAEEVTSAENPLSQRDKSFTWTFYKIATRKGYVDIRWYGTSNGFYSESVTCYLIRED